MAYYRKATASQDGRKRITFKVTVRAGFWNFVALVAQTIEEEETPKTVWTKASLLEAMSKAADGLADSGICSIFNDGAFDHVSDSSKVAARIIVKSLLPELAEGVRL